MDTDGYTTPPAQGHDGMYSPTPHHTTKGHHATGGYGGTSGGGYGHTGGQGPTPTATVAVPTHPPAALPVTSTPAGGHLGVIVAVGVVATAAGLGLLRATAGRHRRTRPAAQHRLVG